MKKLFAVLWFTCVFVCANAQADNLVEIDGNNYDASDLVVLGVSPHQLAYIKSQSKTVPISDTVASRVLQLQSESPATMGSFNVNTSGNGVSAKIAEIIDKPQYFETSRGIAKKISGENGNGPAGKLFGVLAVILLAWTGLKIVAGDDTGELIEAFISISMFGTMIVNYDMIFAQHIPDFFDSVFKMIYAAAKEFPNAVGDAQTMGGIAGALVENMLNVIGRIAQVGLQGLLSLSVSTILLLFFLAGPLMTMIFTTASKYAGLFVLSQVLTSVAIIVGPLCVAFGVLESTKKMFYGWLGVLLGAISLKVIAVASLPVVNMLYQAVHKGADRPGLASNLPDLLWVMIYIEVMAELVNLMPSISREIFGGIVGMGSAHGSTARQASTNAGNAAKEVKNAAFKKDAPKLNAQEINALKAIAKK